MLDSISRTDALQTDTQQVGGWRAVLRELWRRKSSLLGLAGLTLILAIALFAPLAAPQDPLKQDLSHALLPPMWMERGLPAFPLGTDALGRDLASRLFYGARYSLLISTMAALLGSGLGLLLGLLSGYAGGWVDAVLMRLGDIQLAFPFVLLAIMFLGVATDRTPLHLILVLGIPSWIIYARVVRSRVLAERGKDYALAARALGASGARRLFRYILPNVWQVIPVIVMLDLGFLVIIESMLSFLGFGLTPPTPSWGSILAEGKQYMIVSPWMPILPGLAIMATVLCINLTADGLADIFDPRLAGVQGRGARPAPRLATEPAPRHTPTAITSAAPLLQVQDLVTEFVFANRTVRAVRGISFALGRGQMLGIVGESGSGKSVTALSLLRLLAWPGRISRGSIWFDGQELTTLDAAAMAALRGKRIGMIFQNPTSSLNPVLTIGAQMVETLRQHREFITTQAEATAKEAILAVGIGDPERILRAYPFQLSGGMNQRVMIAMTMALEPDLLIADEPTTALDVTTQAQVLERLQAIVRQQQSSLILITHDIALLAGFVDQIVVMYAGQICESGPVQTVIHEPAHPYTRALLRSVPRPDTAREVRLTAIPGDPPAAAQTLTGCPFAPRCPEVMEICHTVNPAQIVLQRGQRAACHLYTDDSPGGPAQTLGTGDSHAATA